ncbi:MAG: ribonuclease M5 [Firmicutes bacterium]|nr:ribonuclease M5 [Bacillota bacterium]
MDIEEVIVVEGRDDTNAIKRAVGAITIETHGFGISKETWDKLDQAYETKGLIIFTDPDHAGQEIRKRLKEKYPEAKEAFLSQGKAKKKGDVGIENASPEDILEALKKARAREGAMPREFSLEDLEKWDLVGREDSKDRREKLGDKLGIGYSNGKTLIKKLNGLGIQREEFEKAMEEVSSEFMRSGNN